MKTKPTLRDRASLAALRAYAWGLQIAINALMAGMGTLDDEPTPKAKLPS